MNNLPINEILCGRNEDVLATFPASSIDLTVTSPPYDNLRTYKGFEWDFDATARELWRVTKAGGVVVWVVADATIDGSETGTSFRQALAFMALGFRLHDTMIWRKTSFPVPTQDRYYAEFEYMFVFSKEKIKTLNFLTDRNNKSAGRISPKETSIGHGVSRIGNGVRVTLEYGRRGNVWQYDLSDVTGAAHSGTFPEKLAEDHILSWSNPGDVVLDPFIGSGTTAKMAIKHHRQFIGIDISPEYCDLVRRRIAAVQPTLFESEAA